MVLELDELEKSSLENMLFRPLNLMKVLTTKAIKSSSTFSTPSRVFTLSYLHSRSSVRIFVREDESLFVDIKVEDLVSSLKVDLK